MSDFEFLFNLLRRRQWFWVVEVSYLLVAVSGCTILVNTEGLLVVVGDFG